MTIGIVHVLHPEIPVPPQYYGGTERVAWNLFLEQYKLCKRQFSSFLPSMFANSNLSSGHELNNFVFNVANLGRNYILRDHVYMLRINSLISKVEKHLGLEDIVIHNHVIQRNSWIWLMISSRDRKVLTTLHYDPPIIVRAKLRVPPLKNLHFVAISRNQYIRLRACFGRSLISYVYNGIPVNEYPFSKNKEDYFITLGAITFHKGTHIAIQVAKRLRLKLLIVGPIRDSRYFNNFIKPHLSRNIRYLGEVDERRKRELLSKARALIFPVLREEFFGLVAIEALACGTPVIAFARGALPEIITDGETGFLARSGEELYQKVKLLDRIDPIKCRRVSLSRFDSRVMTLNYFKLYQNLLAGGK